MDKIVNPNPTVIETNQFHDAINERISKAQAITSLILASHDFADRVTLYGLIWAVDDFLIEMSYLNERSATAGQDEGSNL